MAMDHMYDIKTGGTDLADGSELQIDFVFVYVGIAVDFQLLCCVGKDPVILAFANVERLAISGVNQAIDLVAESLCGFVREMLHCLARSERSHQGFPIFGAVAH